MSRPIHNLEKVKDRRKILRKSATPQETILWSELKGKQLGFKLRRQHSIGKYIVDFYCPAKRLIIEIDGSQHQNRQEYDRQRDKYLENLNFTVLRFWNNEVDDNLDGVLEEIIKYLK